MKTLLERMRTSAKFGVGVALIILSAVSGTGKSTIAQVNETRPEYIGIVYHSSWSCTGEIDVISPFVGTEEFEGMIDAGVFAEWAQYVDNYYGTSRDKVEEAIACRK